MQETRVIDGMTFIVDPMGAMQALKLKVDIIGALGSSLASLINDKGLDAEVDLTKTIEELTSKLTPETFERLTKQLMERANVVIGDNPQMQPLSNESNFNYAFQQSLIRFYKVIWFVIQVNYKDFLEKMGNIGDLAPTLIQKGSKGKSVTSKRKSAK